nr:hypothetical protein [Tanacetum cinerariifolium]
MTDCSCSKWSVEDKILVPKPPKNCARCGHPISSGSTTNQSDISLPEYDSFIFDLSNDQFPPTNRSDFTHEEFGDELAHIISPLEYDCFYFRNLPNPGELISSLNSGIHENLSSTTRVNLPVEDDYSPHLAYVVWIFLAYLTYPVIPPHLHSFENEDTIFDPGITINYFYSFKSGLSHRCGTFKKFNTHRSHLSESPMEITTTQSDISLPEYDSFIFDLSNDQFPPTDRSDFTHKEFGEELAHIISSSEYECFYFGNFPNPGELISSLNSRICENLYSTTRENLPVEDDYSPLLGPTPLEAKDHFEIVINSNDDYSSSDDDSLYYENIDLEVEKIVIQEDEEIENDNLREKLLKFPPTDRSNFTHEEFGDKPAHIISPPEYDCFYFGNLPNSGELNSSLNSGIRENISSTTYVNLPVEDDYSPLLAYVVWIFLAYLTYPVIPPHLHSFRNKDTIFDPGITINRSYSFKPGLSHRCGTLRYSILTVVT